MTQTMTQTEIWAMGKAPKYLKTLVGARGFEPPTPCAQGRCATGLRYAPTLLIFHIVEQILHKRHV